MTGLPDTSLDGLTSIVSQGNTEGVLPTIAINANLIGILGEEALLTQSVDAYKLPEFIIENDKGIFINVLNYFDPKSFGAFLDDLFKSGYYLKLSNHYNVNDKKYDDSSEYREVIKALYSFEEIERYRDSIESSNQKPLIKIAKSINKFDEKRRTFYREPTISKDRKSVDYYFGPVSFDEVDENGKEKEIKYQIDVDEFIAAMWNFGIRSGIDFEVIQKIIASNEQTRFTFATEKDKQKGTNASMNCKKSLDINRGVKDPDMSGIDILDYKQGYVRVEKNVVLYEKHPGKAGKSGWTIFGKEIIPDQVEDISIDSFVGNGVRVEIINGIECIVSDRSGFPRYEEGAVNQGREKIQGLIKIHVDEAKVLHGVNMNSGKVTILEDIISEQDIILDTKARNITAKKNVEANLTATNDIFVGGSVMGTAQNNMISKEHQQVTSTIRGHLKSENGNILIKGLTNGAYLEARKGIIQTGNIANSVIIADTVEISGYAHNCIIIANTITINGKVINCNMVAGKEISMKESTEKGGYENNISIFSRDLTLSISNKEELRAKSIARIQTIEGNIDQEIIQRFKGLGKIEDKRRQSVTRLLVEIMQDPEKRNDSKYAPYLNIYKEIAPLLAQHKADWKMVTDLNTYLTRISKEIQEEKAIMEGYQKQLFVKIAYIHGLTHIQRIKLLENKMLLALSFEELDPLSKLLAGRDNPAKCILEKIPTPESGKFEWQSS